jgi:ubiquinone/menaquinone biosynthesis C-methylase UbiE
MSYLKNLKRNWEKWSVSDPLFGILSSPEKKGNKWQAREFFETGRNEINLVMKEIDLLGIKLSRKKALDFGCGVGRLTQAIAQEFDEADGVDISPNMIDLANKYNKYGSRCKYYLNEKGDLNLFCDDSFDFIYSSLVLMHINPKYSIVYIKEFLRILSSNGLIIFQLHDAPKNYKVLILYKLSYIKCKLLNKPFMESHYIEKDKVIELVNLNGGEVVKILQNSAKNHISYRYFITKKK